MRKKIGFFLFLIVIIFALASSLLIINQYQIGIVANQQQTILEPAVHLRWPSFIEKVRVFDMRPQAHTLLKQAALKTEDNQTLLVNALIRYQIKDVKTFTQQVSQQTQTTPTDMVQSLGKTLINTLSSYSLQDILLHQSQIEQNVLAQTHAQFLKLGVDLLKVRITRLDPVGALTDKIIQRLDAQQQSLIAQIKLENQAKVDAIYQQARLAQAGILEKGYQQAETIRGQADAQAAKIIEPALRENAKFFRFFQNLRIYK